MALHIVPNRKDTSPKGQLLQSLAHLNNDLNTLRRYVQCFSVERDRVKFWNESVSAVLSEVQAGAHSLREVPRDLKETDPQLWLAIDMACQAVSDELYPAAAGRTRITGKRLVELADAVDGAQTRAALMQQRVHLSSQTASPTKETGRTFLMADLCDMSNLGGDTLRTFFVAAGVVGAGVGKRNHTFTCEQAARVFRAGMDHGKSRKTVEGCKDALDRLSDNPK